MTNGSKTNERPGTRARAGYVRTTASKARAVLDLIRGKSYADAVEILAFCQRDAAHPIRKVVDSAVANAEHNGGVGAEELYISACYADEGPTQKRWRPRARGRATRIRKRSCHITVIVSRYDEDTLAELRTRRDGAGPRRSVAAAEARRRRVARSRKASEPAGEQAAAVGADKVEAQAAAVVSATAEALAETDAGPGADRETKEA